MDRGDGGDRARRCPAGGYGVSHPRVWNKRQKGVPPGAVYVGRPTKWGNPFSWKEGTLAAWKVPKDQVLTRYREWLLGQPALVKDVRRDLRGKDLVCWTARADGAAWPKVRGWIVGGEEP